MERGPTVGINCIYIGPVSQQELNGVKSVIVDGFVKGLEVLAGVKS